MCMPAVVLLADDGRDGDNNGNAASNGDSNGSGNAGEDTNSEVLPDWREHANAEIDDDAEPETPTALARTHTRPCGVRHQLHRTEPGASVTR